MKHTSGNIASRVSQARPASDCAIEATPAGRNGAKISESIRVAVDEYLRRTEAMYMRQAQEDFYE